MDVSPEMMGRHCPVVCCSPHSSEWQSLGKFECKCLKMLNPHLSPALDFGSHCRLCLSNLLQVEVIPHSDTAASGASTLLWKPPWLQTSFGDHTRGEFPCRDHTQRLHTCVKTLKHKHQQTPGVCVSLFSPLYSCQLRLCCQWRLCLLLRLGYFHFIPHHQTQHIISSQLCSSAKKWSGSFFSGPNFPLVQTHRVVDYLFGKPWDRVGGLRGSLALNYKGSLPLLVEQFFKKKLFFAPEMINQEWEWQIPGCSKVNCCEVVFFAAIHTGIMSFRFLPVFSNLTIGPFGPKSTKLKQSEVPCRYFLFMILCLFVVHAQLASMAHSLFCFVSEFHTLNCSFQVIC